ncbi:MAG: family 16 glycosylhydrolase [Candidatus Omnitrophica bacterium]|nr:family 16 glycosylhydrolase [Candidatus Omnitrophota bacterium]
MKNWNSLFFISCAILSFSLDNVYSQETIVEDPTGIEEWVLVWSDEFDGKEVDTTKWRIEDAALIKNNELQYYTPEDVYLENGNLVLRSRKKSMGGRDYTSGLVETKGLYTQTYGFFEIRAKLPKGKGIWPAHWMMNAVGTWPPEIDIMELIGHEPNKVHMTNHWGLHPDNRMEGSHFTGPDFSEDFHTFGLQWEKGLLRWFVDGEERYSTTENVHDVPFYLILNTAVGGNWPGKPNATTEFPQYHYIDYVRVFKKNIPEKPFIIASADNGKVYFDPDKERYDKGDDVTITAVPDIGYIFDSWAGNMEGFDNPLTIKMNKNLILKALFEKDPDGPVLISQGKKVVASSLESPELQASNVVDGNLGTRWSSKFSDPQWIYIDLEEEYTIEAVKLYWEAAHGRRYEIQVSNDAIDWTTVETFNDNVGQIKDIWLENAAGRYIRLMGSERATQWGYSLFEIEVFGK